MNKTSDYIEFDIVLNKGFKLLKDKKQCKIGFYIIFSVNSGLRVSDILTIKHNDLINDNLLINEMKTKKDRLITLNDNIKKGYKVLLETLKENNVEVKGEDFVFTSQKNEVYKTQSINVILKSLFPYKNIQVSTHSLRKSFARRIYSNNNESENSLVLISDIFSHSSISISRRYLGIRKESIQDIYLNL